MTRQVLVIEYLKSDMILDVDTDYRVLVLGLELTLPKCSSGDFICIQPLIDNRSTPTVLKVASSVTVNGASTDIDLDTNGMLIIRATGTNEWSTT